VRLALSGSGLSRREIGARAVEALALCGIEALSKRRPASLSGGEQQRAALARALAARPSFLLLDEPFSGLDLVTKAGLLELIRARAADLGSTIALVTHDPLEALALCDAAFVLERGEIVESGSFDVLLSSPGSEMMRVFRDHVVSRLDGGRPGARATAREKPSR
jgi:ABC-type sulfate/molybdate transport systems ATPase subunit